eukprot:TCONS_00022916-protein
MFIRSVTLHRSFQRLLSKNCLPTLCTQQQLKREMSSTKDDWSVFDGKEHFKTRSSIIQPLIAQVLKDKLLDDASDSHLVDVYDLDAFDERIENLLEAFHEPFFLHALAVKSQPFAGILKHATTKYPQLIGLECASFEEASLARAIGTKSDHIVYDSPVKTQQELEKAIECGFYINTDNISEMEMIDSILKKPGLQTSSTFGVRINPLVGEGGIAMSSTAGKSSKFGLFYCDETFDSLLEVFKRFPWLQGVHCHVGSQGCSLDLLSNGALAIYRAAERLNAALGEQQIKCLDIGGGVPTSYTRDKEAVSFTEYRKVLQQKEPDFFSGKYRVITEFGRSVFTKYGMTLTHISCVKGSDVDSVDAFDRFRGKSNENRILLTHVGSNALMREAYQLAIKAWRRRFTVFNKEGSEKEIDSQDFCKYDVAGPLCFQGDYIAKDVLLPRDISNGDILAIHDTGGYTYSLYSHYNSRSPHAVYTVQKNHNGKLELKCIKPKATVNETIQFWNYEQFQ